jgi:hypothetical protein
MAVRVTTRKVLAPVTLAVLDSPAVGRRVAFVEVRITTTTPVRWTEEPNLDIVTDGGDGGFVRGTAEALRDDQTSTDAYIDAFYPNSNSASGNVCVQRITHTGQLDAVMFSTGYGDGGYATFVGRDKDGVIASVVHYGDVLPWRMSGLPGAPPPADETS